MYGREINEYMFEYGAKFLEAYKNQPKYLEF